MAVTFSGWNRKKEEIENSLNNHINNKANPHNVTKEQLEAYGALPAFVGSGEKSILDYLRELTGRGILGGSFVAINVTDSPYDSIKWGCNVFFFQGEKICVFLTKPINKQIYYRETERDCAEWNFDWVQIHTDDNNPLYFAGGYGALEAVNFETRIQSRRTPTTVTGARELILRNGSEGWQDLARAITLGVFKQDTAGLENQYFIYGDHNKPRGEYTGNGSAETREIAIACLGETIAITSGTESGTFAIIKGGGGGIGKSSLNKKLRDLPYTECKFINKTLFIQSTDSILNKAGTVYNWVVL